MIHLSGVAKGNDGYDIDRRMNPVFSLDFLLSNFASVHDCRVIEIHYNFSDLEDSHFGPLSLRGEKEIASFF